MSGLGVHNADVDALVAGALKDPSCGGNPIELTETNVRALFEQVL
jgi:alcohol dehydrogenase class IV